VRHIPLPWLQPVQMIGIVVHWSAGAHTVSALDREHYHVIVSGKGEVVKGDHDIADNVNCADDDYAAHTRGANTKRIGLSMACMAGAVENPFHPGAFPMTKVQWVKMVECAAQLADFYKIKPEPRAILTHAEVQGTLGITQAGKWDVTRLAFDPTVKGAKPVGDRMRAEIAALLR
jgi:hypothetical protein